MLLKKCNFMHVLCPLIPYDMFFVPVLDFLLWLKAISWLWLPDKLVKQRIVHQWILTRKLLFIVWWSLTSNLNTPSTRQALVFSFVHLVGKKTVLSRWVGSSIYHRTSFPKSFWLHSPPWVITFCCFARLYLMAPWYTSFTTEKQISQLDSHLEVLI